MYLKQLKLSTFRNLHSASLEFSPEFNWIFGKNGSGKTSLLETIYLLSTGRSFRTRYAGEFIQEGQASCVASGVVLAKSAIQSSHPTRLGVERHRTTGLRLRMNEQPFDTLSDWVKVLPLQLINIDSYQLLNGPPKPRRQFLDWAMFHVEHSYFSHLQRYRRALKQRNAALKCNTVLKRNVKHNATLKCNANTAIKPDVALPDVALKDQEHRHAHDILAWNPELIEAGEAITLLRKQFLEAFYPIFRRYLNQFLGNEGQWGEVTFDFSAGWHEKLDLSSALTGAIDRDIVLGYTSVGPHKADLRFLLGDTPIETRLSRGQLKMFVSALYLARSEFVTEAVGRAPICLVDDLCSELDEEAAIRLLQGLLAQKAQVFTTSIDKTLVLDQINLVKGMKEANGLEGLECEYRMFHVEHGSITPVY